MGNTPPQQSPAPAPTESLGDNVMPFFNKALEKFAQLGTFDTIELPQVAFVGSPSSGKSSVLEALVGRDFLPKGPTRRPLVLQLRQIKDDTDEGEYGEFSHIPGKKFYDFNEIRMEIQAETDKEAGGGISDKEIQLNIFSPNLPDLTLIDLPGITKLPAPDHIEDSLTNMIMSYIKKPNCLIIAVTPGNTDVRNSDAFEIARKADPNDLRTIGVITKMDVVVKKTDAERFMRGKLTRLQLGYIGVAIRHQEDNWTVQDALAAEEKFFRRHPVFNKVADRCGVPQLAKRLNLIFARQVKKVLLGLESGLSEGLDSLTKGLDTQLVIIPSATQPNLQEQVNRLQEQYKKERAEREQQTQIIQEMQRQLQEQQEFMEWYRQQHQGRGSGHQGREGGHRGRGGGH